MSYTMQLIGLMAIFLSILGYSLFAIKRLELNPVFSPAFSIAVITITTFIFGVYDNLYLGAKVSLYVGVALLAFECITSLVKRQINIKSFFAPFIFFMVIAFVYGFLLFDKARYYGMDDFSHWGLIIKTLMDSNALPDSASKISFINYPPASAVWNYFFCKFSGYSEPRTMLAQFLMCTACLSPVFYKSSFKKPISLIFRTFISLSTLALTGDFYNMRVDVLLGLYTFTAVIYLLVNNSNWLKTSLCVLPFASILVILKDSGKLFLCFVAVFAIVNVIKSFKNKNKNAVFLLLGITSTCIILPLILSNLWGAYQESHWPEMKYEDNKFAFSLEAIEQKFAEKPEQFRKDAPKLYTQRIFNPKETSTIFFFGVNISVLALWLLIKKEEKSKLKAILNMLKFCDIMYVIYLIGLFAMYYLIMPYGEAQNFAEFRRYTITYMVFMLPIISFMIIDLVENNFKVNKKIIISPIILLLLCLMFNKNFTNTYTVKNRMPNYATEETYSVMEQCVTYINTLPNSTDDILMYTGSIMAGGDPYNGFSYWMTRHYFNSKHIYIVASWHAQENAELLIEPMHAYTTLVVLEDDEPLRNALSQYCTLTNDSEFDGNVYRIEKGEDSMHYVLTELCDFK